MLEILPEDVRRGLLLGRSETRRSRHRLSVHVGDAVFPVMHLSDLGFVVSSGRTPRLRGLVDLYDGPRHLSQCLIMASAIDDDVTVYEFKRVTAARAVAARDYAAEEAEGAEAIIASLPRPV